MSKQASEFQEKSMSLIYRGKEIFKPLNTGRIDERVSCVREFIANIFFYTKNGVTIMIDAGYNYPRLKEKNGLAGLGPRFYPTYPDYPSGHRSCGRRRNRQRWTIPQRHTLHW